jgi:hypothetical protein
MISYFSLKMPEPSLFELFLDGDTLLNLGNRILDQIAPFKKIDKDLKIQSNLYNLDPQLSTVLTNLFRSDFNSLDFKLYAASYDKSQLLLSYDDAYKFIRDLYEEAEENSIEEQYFSFFLVSLDQLFEQAVKKFNDLGLNNECFPSFLFDGFKYKITNECVKYTLLEFLFNQELCDLLNVRIKSPVSNFSEFIESAKATLVKSHEKTTGIINFNTAIRIFHNISGSWDKIVTSTFSRNNSLENVYGEPSKLNDEDLISVYAGNYDLVPSDQNKSKEVSLDLVSDYDKFSQLDIDRQLQVSHFLIKNKNKFNQVIENCANIVTSAFASKSSLKPKFNSDPIHEEANFALNSFLQTFRGSQFKNLIEKCNFIIHNYLPFVRQFNKKCQTKYSNSRDIFKNNIAYSLLVSDFEQYINVDTIESHNEISHETTFDQNEVNLEEETLTGGKRKPRAEGTISRPKQTDYVEEVIDNLKNGQMKFNSDFESIYRSITNKIKDVMIQTPHNYDIGSINAVLSGIESISIKNPKTSYYISGYYPAKSINGLYTRSVEKIISQIKDLGISEFSSVATAYGNLVTILKESAKDASNIYTNFVRKNKRVSYFIKNKLISIRIPCDLNDNDFNKLEFAVKRIREIVNNKPIESPKYNIRDQLETYVQNVGHRNEIIATHYDNMITVIKQTYLMKKVFDRVTTARRDLEISIYEQKKNLMIYLNKEVDYRLTEERINLSKQPAITQSQLDMIQKNMLSFDCVKTSPAVEREFKKLSEILKNDHFGDMFKVIKRLKKIFKQSGYISCIAQLCKELNVLTSMNWSEFEDKIAQLFTLSSIDIDNAYYCTDKYVCSLERFTSKIGIEIDKILSKFSLNIDPAIIGDIPRFRHGAAPNLGIGQLGDKDILVVSGDETKITFSPCIGSYFMKFVLDGMNNIRIADYPAQVQSYFMDAINPGPPVAPVAPGFVPNTIRDTYCKFIDNVLHKSTTVQILDDNGYLKREPININGVNTANLTIVDPIISAAINAVVTNDDPHIGVLYQDNLIKRLFSNGSANGLKNSLVLSAFAVLMNDNIFANGLCIRPALAAAFAEVINDTKTIGNFNAEPFGIDVPNKKAISYSILNTVDTNIEMKLALSSIEAIDVHLLSIIDKYFAVAYTGITKLPMKLNNLLRGGTAFDSFVLEDQDLGEVIPEAAPFYVVSLTILAYYIGNFDIKTTDTDTLIMRIPKISPLYKVKKILLSISNRDNITGKANIQLNKLNHTQLSMCIFSLNKIWNSNSISGANFSLRLSNAIDLLFNEINMSFILTSKLSLQLMSSVKNIDSQIIASISENIEVLKGEVKKTLDMIKSREDYDQEHGIRLVEKYLHDGYVKIKATEPHLRIGELKRLINVNKPTQLSCIEGYYKFMDLVITPILILYNSYINIFTMFTSNSNSIDLEKINIVDLNNNSKTAWARINDIKTEAGNKAFFIGSPVVTQYNRVLLSNAFHLYHTTGRFVVPEFWIPLDETSYPKNSSISTNFSPTDFSIQFTLRQMFPDVNGTTAYDYYEAAINDFERGYLTLMQSFLSYPGLSDVAIKLIKSKLTLKFGDYTTNGDDKIRLPSSSTSELIDEDTKKLLSNLRNIKLTKSDRYIEPPIILIDIPSYNTSSNRVPSISIHENADNINGGIKFGHSDVGDSIRITIFGQDDRKVLARGGRCYYSWVDWLIIVLSKCDSTNYCLPYRFVTALQSYPDIARTVRAVGFNKKSDNLSYTVFRSSEFEYVNPIMENIVTRSLTIENQQLSEYSKMHKHWIAAIVSILPYIISTLYAAKRIFNDNVIENNAHVPTMLSNLIECTISFYNDISPHVPHIPFMADSIQLYTNKDKSHIMAEILKLVKDRGIGDFNSDDYIKIEWTNQYMYSAIKGINFNGISKSKNKYSKLIDDYNDKLQSPVFKASFDKTFEVLAKAIWGALYTRTISSDDRFKEQDRIISRILCIMHPCDPKIIQSFLDKVIRVPDNERPSFINPRIYGGSILNNLVAAPAGTNIIFNKDMMENLFEDFSFTENGFPLNVGNLRDGLSPELKIIPNIVGNQNYLKRYETPCLRVEGFKYPEDVKKILNGLTTKTASFNTDAINILLKFIISTERELESSILKLDRIARVRVTLNNGGVNIMDTINTVAREADAPAAIRNAKTIGDAVKLFDLNFAKGVGAHTNNGQAPFTRKPADIAILYAAINSKGENEKYEEIIVQAITYITTLLNDIKSLFHDFIDNTFNVANIDPGGGGVDLYQDLNVYLKGSIDVLFNIADLTALVPVDFNDKYILMLKLINRAHFIFGNPIFNISNDRIRNNYVQYLLLGLSQYTPSASTQITTNMNRDTRNPNNRTPIGVLTIVNRYLLYGFAIKLNLSNKDVTVISETDRINIIDNGLGFPNFSAQNDPAHSTSDDNVVLIKQLGKFTHYNINRHAINNTLYMHSNDLAVNENFGTGVAAAGHGIGAAAIAGEIEISNTDGNGNTAVMGNLYDWINVTFNKRIRGANQIKAITANTTLADALNILAVANGNIKPGGNGLPNDFIDAHDLPYDSNNVANIVNGVNAAILVALPGLPGLPALGGAIPGALPGIGGALAALGGGAGAAGSINGTFQINIGGNIDVMIIPNSINMPLINDELSNLYTFKPYNNSNVSKNQNSYKTIAILLNILYNIDHNFVIDHPRRIITIFKLLRENAGNVPEGFFLNLLRLFMNKRGITNNAGNGHQFTGGVRAQPVEKIERVEILALSIAKNIENHRIFVASPSSNLIANNQITINGVKYLTDFIFEATNFERSNLRAVGRNADFAGAPPGHGIPGNYGAVPNINAIYKAFDFLRLLLPQQLSMGDNLRSRVYIAKSYLNDRYGIIDFSNIIRDGQMPELMPFMNFEPIPISGITDTMIIGNAAAIAGAAPFLTDVYPAGALGAAQKRKPFNIAINNYILNLDDGAGAALGALSLNTINAMTHNTTFDAFIEPPAGRDIINGLNLNGIPINRFADGAADPDKFALINSDIVGKCRNIFGEIKGVTFSNNFFTHIPFSYWTERELVNQQKAILDAATIQDKYIPRATFFSTIDGSNEINMRKMFSFIDLNLAVEASLRSRYVGGYLDKSSITVKIKQQIDSLFNVLGDSSTKIGDAYKEQLGIMEFNGGSYNKYFSGGDTGMKDLSKYVNNNTTGQTLIEKLTAAYKTKEELAIMRASYIRPVIPVPNDDSPVALYEKLFSVLPDHNIDIHDAILHYFHKYEITLNAFYNFICYPSIIYNSSLFYTAKDHVKSILHDIITNRQLITLGTGNTKDKQFQLLYAMLTNLSAKQDYPTFYDFISPSKITRNRSINNIIDEHSTTLLNVANNLQLVPQITKGSSPHAIITAPGAPAIIPHRPIISSSSGTFNDLMKLVRNPYEALSSNPSFYYDFVKAITGDPTLLPSEDISELRTLIDSNFVTAIRSLDQNLLTVFIVYSLVNYISYYSNIKRKNVSYTSTNINPIDTL